MDPVTDDRPAVQQVLDSKGPLKGKGGTPAQWHADAVQRLVLVERDMATLAAESRTIAGRQWSLNTCLLRGGRQLRWRLRSGGHVTWSGIAPLLAHLPPGLARWYAEAEALAQWLNHRGQAIRYEIRTSERLMTKRLQGGDRPPRRSPGRPRGPRPLDPADQAGNAHHRSTHHADQG